MRKRQEAQLAKGNHEPGARSQEPGARSQEPGARRESGAAQRRIGREGGAEEAARGRHVKRGKRRRKKAKVFDGTRTRNLPLRRRMPYPLGHEDTTRGTHHTHNHTNDTQHTHNKQQTTNNKQQTTHYILHTTHAPITTNNNKHIYILLRGARGTIAFSFLSLLIHASCSLTPSLYHPHDPLTNTKMKKETHTERAKEHHTTK